MKPPPTLLCCLALAAPAGAAEVVKVPADWFSCHGGKYALNLPRHYPSLAAIGKHRVVDLAVHARDGVRITTRRFQYIGLRLDVAVSSADPNRYTMLAAESVSRRWHIGRLSVGASPWWWTWAREKSIANVRLDGPIELVGPHDSARLLLSQGRIDKVAYTCRPGQET